MVLKHYVLLSLKNVISNFFPCYLFNLWIEIKGTTDYTDFTDFLLKSDIMTEEQIKKYLGVFRILFSKEEIKKIASGEEKEFVKTVVGKIDGFLAETFKEIKIKDKYTSLTIYYVVGMKKLKNVKKIPLCKDDCELLNNPEVKDSYNRVLNKYLKSLENVNKKTGYYIGVFENKKGEVVKTVSSVVD